MTLAEHIDDIRDKLKKAEYKSEKDVSEYIVQRILHDGLLWPRYNRQIVDPEHRLDGGRVDYALCHPSGQPKVFIEVKDVGKIDSGVDQLFEYAFRAAFRKSVPIIVLTDGHKWRFYNARADGSYEDRVAYELDMIEDSSEKIAERLTRYLLYESVRNGEAFDAIKADHEEGASRREAARNLPKAWKNLIEEENEYLFLALLEATKKLCGHEPTSDQIIAFLNRLGFIKPDPPPPPPNGSKNGGQKPPTRLVVTMRDGEIIDHKNAIDTFVETIDRIGIEQVKDLGIERGRHPLISTTISNTVHKNRTITYKKCGEYYIFSYTNTMTKRKILEKIAKELGEEIQVEIVEK